MTKLRADLREPGTRVAIRYLSYPVRYGTVQGTGYNAVTGTPSDNILRIKTDDRAGTYSDEESYHIDWVIPA
jgi:hypothetical protein